MVGERVKEMLRAFLIAPRIKTGFEQLGEGGDVGHGDDRVRGGLEVGRLMREILGVLAVSLLFGQVPPCCLAPKLGPPASCTRCHGQNRRTVPRGGLMRRTS
jgi:hypothetical protein